MRASVRSGPGASEANPIARGSGPIAPGCDGDGGPATTRDDVAAGRGFERCVNEAIERSGEKALSIATESGLSEFQLSRMRRSAPGFIDRLPERIRRAVAKDYAESMGFKVLEPVTEERLAAIAEELLKATRIVTEMTAEHLRSRMRGGR